MDAKNEILDRLTDSVFLLDLNLNYQYLNKAAAAAIGVDGQQVIGKHILHYHPYLKETALYQDFKQAIQTQQYIYNQQIYPNGQLWMEHHIYPSPQGLSVYARDITEQKQIEQKQQNEIDYLKKKEEWFRYLVENAGDFTYSLTPEGVLTYVSPNWTESMGYDVDEFIGKLVIEELVHPDDMANCMALLTQTFLTGKKNGGIEFRIKHKDGNWRWHTFSLSPLFDRNGIFTCIVGISRDITVNKQFKSALEETEHFLYESQQAANIGCYNLNLETGTWRCSRVMDTIFGITESYPHTLQGWADLVHPDFSVKMKNFLSEIINEKENFDIEYMIIRHLDGAERWLHGSGVIKYGADNNPVSLIGIIQDITSKKLAEETQYFNTRLLEASQSISKLGGWEINLLTNKHTWTNEVYQIHDTTPEEFDSKLGMSYCLPESKKVLLAAMEAAKTQGTPYDLELEKLTFKGRRITIRTTCQVSLQDGKPVKLTGIVQDITEKNAIEAKLRESQNNIRAFFKASTDSVILVDKKYAITEFNSKANQNAFKFFGVGIKIGQHMLDYILPAVRDIFIEDFNDALKGNYVDKEQKIEMSEGESCWWNLRYIPIYDDRQQIIGVSFNSVDITDKKNANEKLRHSNERYQMVARATSDAIWDWDIVRGKVIRTGEGFLKLFGYNAELASTDVDFWIKKVHPDDLQKLEEGRLNIFNNTADNFWEDEYRYKNASEEYVQVYDKGYIIRDETGKAIRMIGATQDISKIKENEKQLQALNVTLQKQAQELAISNKELEYFAYVASHDLQEPLRMVSSFLSQLEKKYNDVIDERGKQYIHFAVDGANRMKQLILDLLEFSRVGRTAEIPQVVDLNKLVGDILIMLGKQIEEKGANITSATLPVISTFKTPVRQVFQNLINNSLKYQQKEVKPCVTISFTETNDHWQFSVADNGIGISDKYFEKIFVLFQRLHNKDEYSGTGIGLAITKKIIENMGGEIWVNSTVGKGTTFYFTIPKKPATFGDN